MICEEHVKSLSNNSATVTSCIHSEECVVLKFVFIEPNGNALMSSNRLCHLAHRCFYLRFASDYFGKFWNCVSSDVMTDSCIVKSVNHKNYIVYVYVREPLSPHLCHAEIRGDFASGYCIALVHTKHNLVSQELADIWKRCHFHFGKTLEFPLLCNLLKGPQCQNL